MEELDLKELISIFLKKKFLIIIVVLIFAIVGAIYTVKFIVPLYKSSTSLVLVQVSGDNQSETNSITTTNTSSIITENATTTLNTSTNESENEVNSLAYTGVENNSILVVVILIGAIVAGYSLKKVKEYNNI